MIQYFENIKKDKHVLQMLVVRDVFSKYRRSFLGVAWSLITPLSMVGVIGLVYSIVFGIPLIAFVPYLFSGLTPWLFISSAIDSGTNAYIVAEGFITQTRINIEIFPLRAVFVAFVNYLFMSIAFFLVYALIKPDAFNVNMFLYFPASLIIFLFCLGVVNIVSIVNLYMRDYTYIQSILLQILFYITPVIYSIEVMDKRGFSGIYKYNPFHYMVDIIRQPMLGASEIQIFNWIVSIGLSVGIFLISIYLTKKIGRKIVYQF